MDTEQLLQSIDLFVSQHTPVYKTEPIALHRPIEAGESLVLQSPAVFQHNINMAGYELRVCGGTIFKEDVIDATVLALGSIVIEGESRNCRIFSMDSIHVDRSEASIFMCYGDFNIEDESSATSSTTIGSINGQKASVYGGDLAAGSDIIVHSAYSPSKELLTSLTVSNNSNTYISSIRILTRYMRKLYKDFADVTHCIRMFTQKIKEKNLYNAEIPQLAQMQKQQQLLQKEIEKKQQLLAHMQQQQASTDIPQSKISILSYASSDVAIDIGGRRYTTTGEMKSVAFSAESDEIAVSCIETAVDDDDTVTYIEL